MHIQENFGAQLGCKNLFLIVDNHRYCLSVKREAVEG